MFWDKEEIGSDGATGAASRFMQYCIEDLARAWEKNVPSSHVLLETRALSADVSAALDPDYQDVHEKQNAALLGYGPVFSKFTGSRGKYGASEADAEFFAVLRGLFNGKGIAWQAAELGKVDHAAQMPAPAPVGHLAHPAQLALAHTQADAQFAPWQMQHQGLALRFALPGSHGLNPHAA